MGAPLATCVTAMGLVKAIRCPCLMWVHSPGLCQLITRLGWSVTIIIPAVGGGRVGSAASMGLLPATTQTFRTSNCSSVKWDLGGLVSATGFSPRTGPVVIVGLF